jgi:hypothetical protein
MSVKTLKTLPWNDSFDERSFGLRGFLATDFVAADLAVEADADLGLLECAAMGLRYHPASSSSIGAAELASNRRRHCNRRAPFRERSS